MKWKILLTTLVIICGLGVFYYTETRQNDPMEVIALIKKNINPKDGSILDYAGDINFRGKESVGYELLGDKKIRIHFGDLQFDLNEEDLLSENLMANLRAIGFDIVLNKKTGKYVVKYHGETVSLFGTDNVVEEETKAKKKKKPEEKKQ